LTKNRFIKIVNEIKTGIVENSKDRKDFLNIVKEYILNEDKEYFLFFDKKEVTYLNEKIFNEFVEWYLNNIIEKVSSKKEAIKKNRNSKKGSLHTTENLLIYRNKNERPVIYFNEYPTIKDKIVIVENFESFLKIDFSLFEEEDFIYLGGYGNTFVRNFLKDKEVLFFVDFDFFGIEIFNSISCKNKKFFIPNDLEDKIKSFGSNELYKKQLFKKDKLKIDVNTKKVYDLINRYSKCLEQEIFNVD